MSKIIGNFLLLALFVSASAFTAAPSTANRSLAPAQISAPEFILTLVAGQIAPGTAKAVWTASNDGPYKVEVIDTDTNLSVYTNATFDDFDIIPNLQPGNYSVTVSDSFNALTVNFVIQ